MHRLTRLFLSEPEKRLSFSDVQRAIGLDAAETRIVIDALKDAGFLVETRGGFVACHPAPAA